MIVKDTMVLIHLAKITLLRKSCEYFTDVKIPTAVHNEIIVGKAKGYADTNIILELIKEKRVKVSNVRNKVMLKKIAEFNIRGGEAEAVALYLDENAGFLASDDDNVRKKSTLLEIKMIGTPSIILKLRKEKIITKEKFENSLNELRKIGWFSNAVIDKVLLEGSKWEMR